MLENWIWNKDILKKVSKHYKTGEPLPEELINQKIATKNEYVATETLSQIFLGTVDFLLYSASDQKLLNASKSSNNTSMLDHMRS
jgi:Zn-dependent oligopeptidase